MPNAGPVAVLTAAAHRAGKRIGDALVDDGWDLSLWSFATLRARVVAAEARGRRAIAVRGDIADPGSVAPMIAATKDELGTVDAVVHVAADELDLDSTGADPITSALVELGAVKVVYIGGSEQRLTTAAAWCTSHQVDVLTLDATDKVHNLAPAVARFLGSS